MSAPYMPNYFLATFLFQIYAKEWMLLLPLLKVILSLDGIFDINIDVTAFVWLVYLSLSFYL